jgi:hypothetical protein
MTEQITPASSVTITSGVTIDSLSANEFAVELDGERAAGIFKVSGMTPFKLDVKPSLTKIVREPFKISKIVQRDPALPFNVWVRETLAARDDIVRPERAVAVIALDEGVETRRWIFTGAKIVQISYSDFNSGSGELIEETLTIMYEDCTESWPGESLPSGQM